MNACLITDKIIKQKREAHNAQGMVEFALVLPVLLLIILGVFAFTHLFFFYILNVSASREAARYGTAIGNSDTGIARYKDCAGIRAAAKRIGTLIGVADANIIISYDNGPGTAVYAFCPVGGQGPNVSLGDRILVQVSTQYQPFLPLVPLPTFPITTVSARTIVKDIYVGSAPPIPVTSTATRTETQQATATQTSEFTATATQTGAATATATQTSVSTATATATATPATCAGTGTIRRQFWDHISGSTMADLYAIPGFPNSPDSSSTISSFDGPVDAGNNFGVRIVGWVCPPYTGDYTFWISSNNEGELWLSTDSSEANKVKIAYIYGWSDYHEWNKYASQQSIAKSLVAGQLYWIAALQKEGGGNDNISVAWAGLSIGASPVVIAGQYLKPGP